MLNSLLLWGASYKTKNYVQISAVILWLTYMLSTTNFGYGVTFPIINAVLFLSVVIISNLTKKIQPYFAACSVLIYSILIDIVCFFIFPDFAIGQTIFQYVFNGLLFNWRFALLPIFLSLYAKLFQKIFKKYKVAQETKKLA